MSIVARQGGGEPGPCSKMGIPMPYLSLPSRRQFLGTALAGAVVVRANSATTRWAFLADTHIPADPANEYRGFRPYRNLREVAARVAEAAPEGVVIAGDLARLKGLPGDYAQLASLLRPLTERLPVGMALGNHDHRMNFLAAFAEHHGQRQEVKDKFILVIETGPVRFILLDSLMRTGLVSGLLGKAQRTWLQEYLRSAAEMPTLLFVHHTLDDRDTSLLDVERMFRIIRPHKMVKAVVYGHSHAYRFDTLDGIRLINLPAVGYNFKDSEPVGWVEATLTAEGGDFKLRAIGGGMEADGKTTSVSWRG